MFALFTAAVLTPRSRRKLRGTETLENRYFTWGMEGVDSFKIQKIWFLLHSSTSVNIMCQKIYITPRCPTRICTGHHPHYSQNGKLFDKGKSLENKF